jgi:ADP-ribose pyrophosphatase YjhB (NUDIX family)
MVQKNNYSKYPKFHVAVDCVIFGYENEELKLLLYPRVFEPLKGKWSLMGGFVREKESMDVAALRVLKDRVGLENIYLEQVGGFSGINRDPGGRVISMAYYALIRIDEHDKDLANEFGAIWWPVTELPEMVFDHRDMVVQGLQLLQRKASIDLVGKELLPERFTLTQLNSLYNAIFQKQFDAGNFRKKLSTINVLEKLKVKDTSSSKRGAFYYKFKEISEAQNIDRIVKI